MKYAPASQLINFVQDEDKKNDSKDSPVTAWYQDLELVIIGTNFRPETGHIVIRAVDDDGEE